MESIIHSAEAFLNSFVMEFDMAKVISFEKGQAVSISVQEGELIIPLSRLSQCGRHEYTGRFLLNLGDTMESIPFELASKMIIKAVGGNAELEKRVEESVDNINAILKARSSEIVKTCEGQTDFITSEQSLFAGHTFHPAPKSRQGFSEEDTRLFAPEFGGEFSLRWFLIDEKLLHQKASQRFKESNWIMDIFREEYPDMKIPEGFAPFFMHPWQAPRSLSLTTVREYKESGKLQEIEASSANWKATSSLRTLYRKTSKWMCKFSMDVKLTNSIRHMLTRELDRGLQVYEVMTSEKIKPFHNEFKNFEVLFEPVYAAIKDQAGNPIQETFIMGRLNSLETENFYSVAFLTQNHPNFGKNYIQKEITTLASNNQISVLEGSKTWLKAFLDKAIKPFIALENNYGVLLGAHQQNLLIKIENHLPTGAVFRDCHGTGYTPKGFEFFKDLNVLSEENGNILPYKEGNHLFSYYLINNTLMNVIAAISSGNFVPEEEMIKVTREFFIELYTTLYQESWCLKTLLTSETILHKGNFLCSLKSVNENTTNDPLSIYVEIKNPFYLAGTLYA